MKSILHWRKLVALAFLSIAVLFSFQNCGSGFQIRQNTFGGSINSSLDGVDAIGDVPLNPAAPLSVYARAAEVTETGILKFKIELNKASDVAISVSARTLPGTALAGTHYENFNGTVVVPAGQTSVELPIQTLAFEASTINRQLSLEVFATSSGVIGQPLSTGAIKASQQSLDFKQISVGSGSTCGLTLLGTIKCWGVNNFGQLGNNSRNDSWIPVEVVGLTGAKQVEAADGMACAITATDGVKCWGSNSSGRLGNNSLTDSPVPVDVVGLTGIKEIALGGYYSCAITAQDTVKCWGYPFSGPPAALVPVEIPGLNGIKHIAMSTTNACVITNVGSVKCWGYNTVGQLGNNSMVNSLATPVDVLGLSGVTQIAIEYNIGQGHSCALSNDGTVKCWGSNNSGQLGNNTMTRSLVATPVSGLTGIKSIGVSFDNSCAVTAQDTVKCWGLNGDGQLGIGNKINSLTPVDVSGLTGVK
jgi:alpha-tubulin suppressor-like RCC1 family protein